MGTDIYGNTRIIGCLECQKDYDFDIVRRQVEKEDPVGPGRDSDASEWIIKVLDRPDPRPVWFSIWVVGRRRP